MNRRTAIKTTLSAAAAAAAAMNSQGSAARVVSQAQGPNASTAVPPLEGRRTQHSYTARKYNPGAVFDYTVYTSKHYKPGIPAAVVVQFDNLNLAQTAAMEKLVGEGAAPAFVVIVAPPGRLEPTMAGGTRRALRVENYDHIGTEFPNFLVEELIPEATRVENLTISTNPDLHMTSGGSSGGTCAFNACWFRNDYFRRGFLSSPSFHSLAGGDEVLPYVQKCEPRPFRVL